MNIPALQLKSPTTERESPPAWMIVALIALTTLIAYWPVLPTPRFSDSRGANSPPESLTKTTPSTAAGYIWDDDSYLTENKLVQSGFDGLRRIWLHVEESPQYYPLVFTSFWIEHKLWGLAPGGYHTVNVLLHIANALLAWRIARRLRIPLAWLIGAIFALHPVHVESVAWVTERKNVLSGLFYLLSLREFIIWSDGTRAAKWHYGAGLLAFVCALLSKSVTAMLAPSLPLILWYYHGKITVRQIAAVAPLLLIGAAKGLLTAKLEMEKVGASGAEWSQTLAERAFLIAPSAYVFYAQKLLWPGTLAFMYPRWNLSQADITWYLPLVLAIAALAIALAGRRRWGIGPTVLLLFAAVNLFPALGFLNVYPHRYSFVADHFQYLASLGFITLFVVILHAIGRRLIAAEHRSAATGIISAVLIAAMVVRSNLQAQNYRDERTLYEANLRANPDAWLAMINLGQLLRREAIQMRPGSEERVMRLKQARALFEQAARYDTPRLEAYTGIGNVAFDENDPARAAAAFRKAVEFAPANDASALNNLAIALKDAGQIDEALTTMDTALKIKPERATSWYNLSAILYAANRPSEAADAAAKSVTFAPDQFEFRRNYAILLSKAGRHADAAAAYAEALRLRPENADCAYQRIVSLYDAGDHATAIRDAQAAYDKNRNDMTMRVQLIWMLATCPDDKLRNGGRAAVLADPLVRGGVGGAPWQVLDALAAAAAETGDFPQALSMARQARDGAAREGRKEQIAAIDARIALYEQSRPYRHSSH